MTGILTVTLNPALDVSTSVDHLRAGDKLRCAVPSLDTGGGGVNVARAIGELGGRATAFVTLAGHTGAQFRDLLEQEPLVPLVFDIPGDTRQSLAVTDASDGKQYRFVMPGPLWSDEIAREVLAAIAEAAPADGLVVLSGSQPPGVADDFPAELAAAVVARGARLVLDTSGPPLRALLTAGRAGHDVLRLDGAESAELAGRSLDSQADVAAFAQSLVADGVAAIVVLALGPGGSVLATRAGRWHCNTIDVPVKSKVGAGDSFVGAFTLALSRGAAPEAALVQGCAAASAAVMTDATALCRREDVEALAKSAVLTPL
ncbi:hexose kinase [Maritimibacter sp. UBA3975]|uniref:1-phosphofructokinase family hexose kinase n=1 Tax=Maritimibacter sp. UBA3975 TaxID=1946833 RepID=UPI000C094C24|nr:hexose kinase [Maritimibacter sp. UBA3975]MAM62295.1 sugar kinase [Maritimibacter sp.]